MLGENIKEIRKSKGLSQEELAVKVNVVRQTVSKWEQGLSVPDAELLLALSQALDTPTAVLLGESVKPETPENLKAISEKLEVLNLQLARKRAAGRKIAHGIFLALCGLTVIVFAALVIWGSPYLAWDYSDPETAVFGAAFHAFEYVYVRVAPVILLGGICGAVLTGRRN